MFAYALIFFVFPAWLGIENLFYFLKGTLGPVSSFLRKIIGFFLWDMGEWGIVIITTVFAFVILGLVSSEKNPKEARLIFLIKLLCAFPIIKIAIFAMRYVLFWCFIPSDRLFAFFSEPKVEWIVIGAVYLCCLIRVIKRRMPKKKIVSKYKEIIGPDGNPYLVPSKFQDPYNFPEGGEKAFFKNGLHRLLFASEFADLSYAYYKKEPGGISNGVEADAILQAAFGWENNLHGSEEMRYYNDWTHFYADLLPAMKPYTNYSKAVHYFEMFIELAWDLLIAWEQCILTCERDILWHGTHTASRGFRSERVLPICKILVDIYQNGCPGVQPSAEKAAYYTEFPGKFEAKEKRANAVYSKKLSEDTKRNLEAQRREREELRRSVSGTQYTSEEYTEQKPEQTYFAFPRYIYDEDENPWELTNSGYDNATYYCQKTGETKTFYKSDFEIGSPYGFHQR